MSPAPRSARKMRRGAGLVIGMHVDASEHVVLPRGAIVPGWRLLKTLMLRIERDEDGSFVVSDDIFALHGDGETRDAAIRDYVQTLIEYHDLLVERAIGDQPTSALLSALERYLEKEGDV